MNSIKMLESHPTIEINIGALRAVLYTLSYHWFMDPKSKKDISLDELLDRPLSGFTSGQNAAMERGVKVCIRTADLMCCIGRIFSAAGMFASRDSHQIHRSLRLSRAYCKTFPRSILEEVDRVLLGGLLQSHVLLGFSVCKDGNFVISDHASNAFFHLLVGLAYPERGEIDTSELDEFTFAYLKLFKEMLEVYANWDDGSAYIEVMQRIVSAAPAVFDFEFPEFAIKH